MNRVRIGSGVSEESDWIIRHADFPSRHIAPRHVDVWCPPAAADPALRYPVIYMHDGQNLFDPALSFIGVDWGVIEAMTGLMQTGGHPGAIVVGIWNSPQRWRDYMPAKPLYLPEGRELLAAFSEQAGGEPLSDGYLRFIVEELKPFIDATYPTMADRSSTFVMGSSMGALISLYALAEYPDLFGGAGCLSTHWPIGEQVLLEYFSISMKNMSINKLYFDYGTEDLDRNYEDFQIQMDRFLQKIGCQRGRDWLTLKFQGAEHSERAWRARLQIPLAFLLGIESARLDEARERHR